MNTMQNPRMQAEALKRMGRGPDTQLIHMTDSEIDALNGLSALVFKEPLRTNPETGLPEAGLFKRLLPTVLAIGAATFLGPAVAPAFASMGAGSSLAAGLGAGVAGFGGHALGRAATGQKFDLVRSGLAGLGSGLTAGLTAPSGGEIVDAVGGGAGAGGMNPVSGAVDIPMGGFETFGSGAGTSFSPAPALESLAAGSAQTAAVDAAPSLIAGSGPGGMRTFSEGFDYLAGDPLMRVAAPLGVAALTGEFNEPLPEAPAGGGGRREPFVPTALRASRERRDLDLDEDGEVTEKDIMQVVQGLPEGQSSRFFEPTRFTPVKTGGLVNLEQGGSIKEAIQNLTGGEGATILPMIAQAVVKPGEEEEEATTKGYPLGTPGTPPGMPTTGIAIGGGQPPQPFQTGGPTALDKALGGDDGFDDDNESNTGTGDPSNPADPANVAGALGTIGGLAAGAPGLGALASGAVQAVDYTTTPQAQRGSLRFEPLSLFGLPGTKTIGEQKANLFTQHELDIDSEQAEAEEAAATAAAVSAMAGLGMDLGDQPEEGEPGSPSVPGGLPSLAEAAASVVSSAPGIGGPASGASADPTGAPSGGGSGGGESTEGGHDIGGGGAFGGDDTGPDTDSSDSPSDTGDDPGGPIKTGGQVGIGMQRLLKFEQGGLAGIPYFEGRVMPTGDPKEDGMSDNIPFVIAGQEGGKMGIQPAILSPDEYVIPADVVSMLGNGSSTAGSNQLDQFISNFRMDKYGRPKQPPEMRGGLNSLA